MRRLYTAITALFLATLLVSGVIVHAQATDPLSIADAYLAALNAGDVEAAVAFFADDAVRTSGPVQVTGKDEIRRDVERLVAMRVSVETVGPRQVAGDRVTWLQNVSTDGARNLGAAPFQVDAELVGQGGKIKSYTTTVRPESQARLDAAQAVLGVRRAFDAAQNAGDVDGMVALISDEAVRIATDGSRQVGREQFRGVYAANVAQHIQSEIVQYQVAGDRITAVTNVSTDSLRSLGVAPVQNVVDFIVRGGKIVSSTVTRTPESVIKEQAAGNKAIAARAFDAINAHDVDAFTELLAPDFVDRDAMPGQDPGIEGTRSFFALLFAAVPDLWVTADLVVSEGDTVVVRGTERGTQTGEFFGLPPTGKAYSVTGTDILRIQGGKIVERWGNFDDLGLLRQLGVIPTMQ